MEEVKGLLLVLSDSY